MAGPGERGEDAKQQMKTDRKNENCLTVQSPLETVVCRCLMDSLLGSGHSVTDGGKSDKRLR